MFDNSTSKDNQYSTVAIAPSPPLSGTSLSVQPTDGVEFAEAPFWAFICPPEVQPLAENSEKVRVTAKSGDKFTIERAQLGSRAQQIATGWVIFAGDSAQSWLEVHEAIEGEIANRKAAVTAAEVAATAEVATETSARKTAVTTAESNAAAEATAAEGKAISAASSFASAAQAAAEAASDPAGSATTAEGKAISAAKTTSEAEVKVEKERAEAAEALRLTTAEKGAASGVASLTAGSIGAQPPAHHASTHAEGGTDPLTVGDLPASVVTGRAPAPSGDETGATDTAALEAAMPASGFLLLRPGSYYVTKLPVVGPGQGIRTMGVGETVVYLIGKGTCLRVHNAAFPTEGQEHEFTNNMPGKTGGFTIDGSKAEAGATGLWAGDIYCLDLSQGVVVRHFTGAGSTGALFKSAIGWCERAFVTNCHVTNCTNCVVFSNEGTGTGSFDYSHFEMTVQAYAGQNGVVTEKGIQLQGCYLKFGGNCLSGVGNTSSAVILGEDESAVNLTGSHLDWQFECDGTEGTGHKTITMGKSALLHCAGVLVFYKGTVAFANGNVKPPAENFSFSGFIKMDENVGVNGGGEGLNVVGGSTWQKGFSGTENGKVSVNTGDYFLMSLKAGALNTIVLENTTAGRARTIRLIIKQPTGGSATALWTALGNNAAGVEQKIIWPGGGGHPILQTAEGLYDVIELTTYDGVHWIGASLTSLTYAANLAPESVEAGAIKALGIGPGRIENEAIETGKIKNSAVTDAKRACGAAPAYGGKTEHSVNEEIEASATLRQSITLTIETKAATRTVAEILVNKVFVGKVGASAAATGTDLLTFKFDCPATQKWECKVLEGTVEKLYSSQVAM